MTARDLIEETLRLDGLDPDCLAFNAPRLALMLKLCLDELSASYDHFEGSLLGKELDRIASGEGE